MTIRGFDHVQLAMPVGEEATAEAFYAGVLGFARGLVPIRSLAIAQGALMGLVAVALPVWQILKLVTKVGFTGWAPGMGLLLVLGCGLMAMRTVVLLARPKTA